MSPSAIKRPEKPARETIAPSDLTFGLSTCKRCIWIKYWFKVTMPGQFPLVKPLADSQEEHFRRAAMQDLDPGLAPGVVKQWGQWVKSAPLVIAGRETSWKILGIYDLLAHYEDGSVGIIDCKVSDSDRDNGAFYAPQLEAYAHALEKPDRGKPFPVSSMGLLVWRLNGVTPTADGAYGFGVTQHYLPVERDSQKFNNLLEELVDVIEGDFPDAGPECPTCNYLVQRAEIQSL
uniref:PD-(D/E)XK nuclease family protein n=1 Tax=Candidatus Planktophila sp. TaxID=2175601 RepID=UPI00404B6A29